MKISDKMFLGTICKKGHDHEATGKSLRYKSTPGVCVLCKRIQSSQWSENNQERTKELQTNWNVSHKDHHSKWKAIWRTDNPFKRSISKIKSRALRKGIPFDIDEVYMRSLWAQQDGLCYWLKCPMYHELNMRHPQKATVDRLELGLGYIKGNVVWATSFANLGRNTLTVEEFKLVLPILGFK